jgi:hypothetical protein
VGRGARGKSVHRWGVKEAIESISCIKCENNLLSVKKIPIFGGNYTNFRGPFHTNPSKDSNARRYK